jgi:hypothetical protein
MERQRRHWALQPCCRWPLLPLLLPRLLRLQ